MTRSRVIFFALTAAFGMLLCRYLHADFLLAVGVTPAGEAATQAWITISLAVTGLVVGGGSDGLHALITNITKSTEKKDTPRETGGSA